MSRPSCTTFLEMVSAGKEGKGVVVDAEDEPPLPAAVGERTGVGLLLELQTDGKAGDADIDAGAEVHLVQTGAEILAATASTATRNPWSRFSLMAGT
jgi:hypothetical protein